MGVSGLWELLSPVGRKVSIETLQGKILAIDASIWIMQFINAMKDEDGKVSKNAHLIGTVRRILKLLFHGILPIFVFDGATPPLKVKTVRARRLLRERHENDIKKAAEKILLSRLAEESSRLKTSHGNHSNFALGFLPPSEDVRQSSTLCQKNIEDDESALSTPELVVQPNSEDEWEDGNCNRVEKRLRDGSSSESDDDGEGRAWGLPEDARAIDLDVLSALPKHIRKTVIEDARKRESRRRRTKYLPVAENPQLYSQTQIANFLRTSQLNQVIEKSQKLAQAVDAASYEKSHSAKRGVEAAATLNDVTILGSVMTTEYSNFEGPFHHESLTECLVEGGFVVETSKPLEMCKMGLDQLCQSSTQLVVRESEWKCRQCTMYNGYSEDNCILCGNSAPRLNEFPRIDSTGDENVSVVVSSAINSCQQTSCDNEESDTESWEENDFPATSSPITSCQPDVPITSDVTAHSFAQVSCSDDLVTRAVSSARSMGDWAGRAVRLALQRRDPVHEESASANTDVLNGELTYAVHGASSYWEPSSSNLGEVDCAVSPTSLIDCDISRTQPGYTSKESLESELVEEMKQLLDAFDLPYMAAPFEAEAQCAFLEQRGLVHGVVTEDSDAFLFGAKCVYKNIFSEKKFVEVYLLEDLKRDLGLDRGDLIALAYLLGSDYSEGIKGVGIVNAMEIIEVFGRPSISQGIDCKEGSLEEDTLVQVISGLERFRDWLEEGCTSAFIDGLDNCRSASLHGDCESDESDGSDKVNTFDKKHRNAKRTWVIDKSFPDSKIAEAYLRPEICRSLTPFSWEKPKLFKAKRYCQDVLGWTEDEISTRVTPVIKRCLSSSTDQTRIDSYYVTYHDNSRVASIRSSRLRKAVDRVKNRRNRHLK